ncbi:MAG: hypothetical protein QM820_30090 [Minicystis sp.]
MTPASARPVAMAISDARHALLRGERGAGGAHGLVAGAAGAAEDGDHAVAERAVAGAAQLLGDGGKDLAVAIAGGGREAGEDGRDHALLEGRREHQAGAGGGRVVGWILRRGGVAVPGRDRGDGVGEVARRREALQRILGERAVDEGVERVGHAGDEVAKARGIGEDDLGEDGELIVAGERTAAGDQLEEHDAEGELIGARGDPLLAAHLLRRHVRGRADGHAHRGERRLAGGARDAEIDELGAETAGAVLEEVDVGRLDVAVDDADVVERGEAAGDLRGDVERLGDGEAPALLPAREVLAFEPLDDEARPPSPVDAVGDVADDVRIVDLREQPGLAAEPLERVDVVVDGEQPLDRDDLAGVPIEGAVHVARAPAAHPRFQGEARFDREVVRHPALHATPDPPRPPLASASRRSR